MLDNREKYECYAKADGKWIFTGWYEINQPVTRENNKYWFTSTHRYRKSIQGVI